MKSSAYYVNDVNNTLRTHSNVMPHHELTILIAESTKLGYLITGQIEHYDTGSIRVMIGLFTTVNHKKVFCNW